MMYCTRFSGTHRSKKVAPLQYMQNCRGGIQGQTQRMRISIATPLFSVPASPRHRRAEDVDNLIREPKRPGAVAAENRAQSKFSTTGRHLSRAVSSSCSRDGPRPSYG